MTDIVRNITLDQKEIPLFISQSEDISSASGGLIVIHEIFGLNEHIKDLCRRFSERNLAVFAPDLFFAYKDFGSDRDDLDIMRSVWQSIDDQWFVSALEEVFTYADSILKGKPIGIIGYCMGGAIALMSAANNKKIAYLIDYYGRIYYQQLSPNKPKHPIDWAKNLSCPTLGLFSGIDPLIPEEHVHELQSLLNRANIANEFKIYPHAKHAFFNDRRENYDQPAAQDAWKLTMDFISNSIRSFK